MAEQIKYLIKKVYDYTKDIEESSEKNTLPQLIVKGFDEEQIWQELELQNESCLDDTVQNVSHLSAKKDKLKFPLKLNCNKSKDEEIEIKTEEDFTLEDKYSEEDTQDLNGDEDEEDDLANESAIPQKSSYLLI